MRAEALTDPGRAGPRAEVRQLGSDAEAVPVRALGEDLRPQRPHRAAVWAQRLHPVQPGAV